MRFAKAVVKYRIPILIIAIILMIPSVFGMINTRINYDMLSYLPEDIDTVIGQNELLDEFGKGAFAFIIVEDMPEKDVAKLAEKIENVDHVESVLSYASIVDASIPKELLPDSLYREFNTDHSTLMAVFFEASTSDDVTLEAIREVRSIAGKQCFVSGMSAMVVDMKELCESEELIYIGLAVLLSSIAMILLLDNWIIPFVFLISIGMMILMNMGTNYFIGEISFITKSLSAVLQLAVTMDYSIFLWHSYNEQCEKYSDHKEAMAVAIKETLASVVGGSATTVAGFIALCFMSFTLGKDIGIVMAKGVIFGVLVCVTVLPSMILCCDKLIEKTKHKPLLPDIGRISDKVTKRYVIYVVTFVILLFPAIYGNNHTGVYYNLDESLPKDLPSVIANTKLKEDYNMNTTHMILVDSSVAGSDVKKMSQEIEKVDGVKWVLGLDNLVGSGVPADMLPESVTGMLKNDKYQLLMVNSTYKVATDKVNKQIEQIDKIMDKYDKGAMLVGEGPLTKDLINITDTDFKRVSAVSIGIVFVIILLLFKSITIPVILVGVIEFAIFVNMGIPFYTGTKLPFVASIVIGTIQLGATVDYAILMTTRYQRERSRGAGKFDAITTAHKFSAQSIIVSALSFFAATIGVGLYSNIDMISSLCILMARGALISMVVVVLILPSLFMVFDKIIVKTSKGFRPSGLKS